MDVFHPAHPDSYRLQVLPIRERDFNSDDPHDLIAAVRDTVHALERYGAYQKHEIPEAIRLSCLIGNYEEEVSNGGHEQFVSNGRWAAQTQLEIEQGLGAMGAHTLQVLFREVAQYINSAPYAQRATLMRVGFDRDVYGKVDPWISQKDGELFALMKQTDFPGQHARWLRSLECIQSVADSEWKYHVGRAIEAQILREARQGAKGLGKDDFLADICARAPQAKSLDAYVVALGARCNIVLDERPARAWQTRAGGKMSIRLGFETQWRSAPTGFRYPCFLVVVDSAGEHMTLHRFKSTGRNDVMGVVGPAIGQLRMARGQETRDRT